MLTCVLIRERKGKRERRRRERARGEESNRRSSGAKRKISRCVDKSEKKRERERDAREGELYSWVERARKWWGESLSSGVFVRASLALASVRCGPRSCRYRWSVRTFVLARGVIFRVTRCVSCSRGRLRRRRVKGRRPSFIPRVYMCIMCLCVRTYPGCLLDAFCTAEYAGGVAMRR